MENLLFENAGISKINTADPEDICRFIENEIDPYLSIPLKNKITVKNLSEYALKLIDKADGYVYMKNGKIQGIIAGYIRNRDIADEVYITMYGVAKKFRQGGVGGKLMQLFLENVPNNVKVWTTVDEGNKIAQIAYMNSGFEVIDVCNGRLKIIKNI